MRKCVVCAKELNVAKKKRFCGESCSKHFAKNKFRLKWERLHPKLPNRKCKFCNKMFQPKVDTHRFCSARCRNELSKEIRRLAPKKEKPIGQHRFWVKKSKQYISHKSNESLGTVNSKYQEEIKEFLKKGGKIDRQPDQLNGRTPAVNAPNLSGWSVETMFGFGYELELLDEISELSNED